MPSKKRKDGTLCQTEAYFSRRGGAAPALINVLDQAQTSIHAAMIAKLQAAGVPVEVSEQARLLHHKFAVIDGRYVVTGSYNWTESAERRNRESLVILDCPEVASVFATEWDSIRPDAPQHHFFR
jgi:phosphatidylserine/phosphatidylglycerophosphate/cardiolipin synthase-like enzyme